MAFIYTRATAVISWLGAPPQVSGTAGKSFIELGEFWNAGDGRCIASQFASAIRHPPAGAPAKPFTWAWRVKNKADMRTMQSARVAANPYWQRMWIVQEVCLPQHLAFLCGGYLWTESMMWDAIKANKSVTSPYDSEVLLQVSGEAAAPAAVSEQYHATMERLLSVRSTRFSDATRLESLMEHFMDYGCQKSRDRVFGLAGLANDIEPFAVAKGAVSQSPSAMPSGTPSGTSRLEIDYTRSYYDIWCDVVAHMYFRATPLLDFGDTPNEKEDERRIRVVRFAGVVQRALDGQVEEERTLLHEAGMAAQVPREPLKVKGYIAGRILSLGPRYTEGLGCSRADQHWLASSKTYYTKAGELETLRRTEASYKTKILAYSSQDLRRICIIDSASAIAWGILQPPPDEPVSLPPLVCTMASRQAGDSAAANREPVRFLGTSLLTGLAPASAGVGDIIIRFWNCDAAIVVRPTMPLPVDLETDLLDARLTYCRIVGRADIAETYERPGDGTDDMAKRLMDVLETSEEIEGMSFQQYSRGVYVRLDFATLQKISAAIHI
ncbi:HET domain-containing protein [Verticillium dahliae VdLs.17]|uniref:HET domain-containing protein n=1 Tax=Verticillium dahliae (strain VdLs.17 / ATCC MYA-4575 / FGSC 10137) TaxID=498257 RepID=G2WXU5_VERDV|nr:HET domain-containing protein [Verticillium dahliae VdLs.17]EGY20903.1 HET domain-containing protein [Verticillium dahliae VdLs.17]